MSIQRLKLSEFTAALRAVGVEQGDTVHVQSSLPHVGPVEAGDSREEILQFYLRGFQEALGPTGTLLVHTPFEDYGRYGVPFVVEESPSRAGVFSEFIRTRAGAVRSMHPIVSTAGIGPAAREICDGSHFEGFGWASSWGRMHRANVMFLALGLTIRSGLSFAHYVESLYGVPYQYCKVYGAPVVQAGQPVEGTFTMRVRFLDFSIAVDTQGYQDALFKSGAARAATCGRGPLHAVRAGLAFDVGVGVLEKDVYGFLAKRPAFRHGEIPCDGPTGHPRYSYDQARNRIPERDVRRPDKPVVANFDALSKQDQ